MDRNGTKGKRNSHKIETSWTKTYLEHIKDNGSTIANVANNKK